MTKDKEPQAGGETLKRRVFGGMAGTITIMPGVDLTEPTESWDTEDRPDDVIACLNTR